MFITEPRIEFYSTFEFTDWSYFPISQVVQLIHREHRCSEFVAEWSSVWKKQNNLIVSQVREYEPNYQRRNTYVYCKTMKSKKFEPNDTWMQDQLRANRYLRT